MLHRLVWKRLRDFFIYRVLHVDDTPHRIALGVAIGIFVTWTPTVGFQMMLTVALAWLLRANVLVGAPFVWISNPLTFVPIYLPNYYVGRWILSSDVPPPNFRKVIQVADAEGWLDLVTTWWDVTWHAFYPLWVGSVLVGLFLATGTYFATYFGVVTCRQKMPVLIHHIQQKLSSEPSPGVQPPICKTEREPNSVRPD